MPIFSVGIIILGVKWRFHILELFWQPLKVFIMILVGYAMRDHIHMLLMIPPKFSVAHTVGFLKGNTKLP